MTLCRGGRLVLVRTSTRGFVVVVLLFIAGAAPDHGAICRSVACILASSRSAVHPRRAHLPCAERIGRAARGSHGGIAVGAAECERAIGRACDVEVEREVLID